MRPPIKSQPAAELRQLLSGVPFILDIEAEDREKRGTAVFLLVTPTGKFPIRIERATSYLGQGVLAGVIGRAMLAPEKHPEVDLLVARYVPLPSAEKLVEAGVCFVDHAGNMHLTLGKEYSWTVLGRKEVRKDSQDRKATPSKIQLLFTLAANPELATATVRKLADEADIKRSTVAALRRQLLEEGLVVERKDGSTIASGIQLQQKLVHGYENLLRPKIVIGRFRSPDASLDAFLDRITDPLDTAKIQWSLTGGWGVYQLQEFYKGPTLTLHISTLPNTVRLQLRLLPDRDGPITLLKTIGTASFWTERNGRQVAHPYLLYSELLCSEAPRAIEAAENLRQEFLKDE